MPTNSRLKTYAVQHVIPAAAPSALAFHRANVGKHIVPRDEKAFEVLVRDQHVYQLAKREASTEEIVGICYVAPDNGNNRDEFGGFFVIERERELGLATALGYCAIATHFIYGEKRDLIAHVHERNEKPRGVLNRLGFIWNGKDFEELPPEHFTPEIEKNSDGQVVGHLFRFQKTELIKIADWLELWVDVVCGKHGKKASCVIELPMMEYKQEHIQLLRDIATNKVIP